MNKKKWFFTILIVVFEMLGLYFIMNLPLYHELKFIEKNIDNKEKLSEELKSFYFIKGIEVINLLDENKNIHIGTLIGKKKELNHLNTTRLINVNIYYMYPKTLFFISILLVLLGNIGLYFIFKNKIENKNHFIVSQFFEGFIIITDKNFNIRFSSLSEFKGNLKKYLNEIEGLQKNHLEHLSNLNNEEKITLENIEYKKRKYDLQVLKYDNLYYFYFKDITGLLFFQEQIKKSEQLSTMGRFSSMVAHELRNPLGTIRSSAETILEEEIDQDNIKLLNYIIEESERLSNLVDKMLNFSRKLELNKEYINVKDFLLFVRDEFLKKNDDIMIKVDFKSPIIFCTLDRNLMYYSIINIMENGYKAIKRKGNKGKITIISEKKEKFLIIRIINNGEKIIGDYEKLFEPFYTTDSKGFGLGLAIVKKIVEQHKGRIEVKSNDNETEFKIILECER